MSNKYNDDESVKHAIAALQMQNELIEKENQGVSMESKKAMEMHERQIAAEHEVVKEAVVDALMYGRNLGESVIEADSYLNKSPDFLNNYQKAQGGRVDLKDFADQWENVVQCISEEDKNATIWERRDINDVARDCLAKYK